MGSIRRNAEAFENAPRKAQIPKNFKNCVRQPILTEADEKLVSDVLPIASLHLKLRITNKLVFKVNDEMGCNLVSKLTCTVSD